MAARSLRDHPNRAAQHCPGDIHPAYRALELRHPIKTRYNSDLRNDCEFSATALRIAKCFDAKYRTLAKP